MEPDDILREKEAHLRLSEKMEAVGMLARGLAHDFNNILSGVLGFTSYLKSKTDPATDVHRGLSLIEESGIKAAELTRQLAMIARRRHGTREPLSMTDAVEDAFGAVNKKMPENVRFERRLVPGTARILGDEEQIGHALANLFLRAFEAMAETGGVLTVEAESRPLTAREKQVLVGAADTEYVCLRVRDTGRVLSPEEQARLFDPFYLSKTTRDGLGLALVVVYAVVANHRGDVSMESAEGQGTTFSLYIPAYEPDARDRKLAEEGKLDGTETVMVVDDEAMVRQVVAEILGSRGYRVVTAASGEQAIEYVKKSDERVDLFLLDVVMPGMGGEAAFRVLRQLRSDAKVMLTSMHAQDDVGERLTRDGASGIVYKPYKREDLLVAVRRALDGKTVR